MKSERYYTVLGIFVMGGFLLGFSFLYYFYIQAQARNTETFVMFFDGSLRGLETGSPVTYRGVKIGRISRIEMTEDTRNNEVLIPVYVQFYVEKDYLKRQSPLEGLIKRGWSADISKPNLITGVADIEIIQAPGSIKIKQTYYHGYRLFPTVKISHKEQSLDETLAAAEKLFNSIKEFVESDEVNNTINAIKQMSRSFNNLATSIDQQVPTVTAYFNQTLKEISQAAYATTNLTDYLSQYPETLLRGKRAN